MASSKPKQDFIMNWIQTQKKRQEWNIKKPKSEKYTINNIITHRPNKSFVYSYYKSINLWNLSLVNLFLNKQPDHLCKVMIWEKKKCCFMSLSISYWDCRHVE